MVVLYAEGTKKAPLSSFHIKVHLLARKKAGYSTPSLFKLYSYFVVVFIANYYIVSIGCGGGGGGEYHREEETSRQVLNVLRTF